MTISGKRRQLIDRDAQWAPGYLAAATPDERALDRAPLPAPGFRWFTESFDTFDLKQAAALLSELGCADP